MKIDWIKTTLYTTGIYDGVLGVVFLFFGMQMFDLFGVTRPNHVGYIQFPALLLIVFGIMFLNIARDPKKFRSMIWYGMGLKASYFGVVFYHLMGEGLPSMWVPFAVIDVVFFVLMFAAWRTLRTVEPA